MVEGKRRDATCLTRTHVTCLSESKALKEAFFQGQVCLSIYCRTEECKQAQTARFLKGFSFCSLSIVGINART